jgi:hypothetical protein
MMGRQQANVTYPASQEVDVATGITTGIDLTPLAKNVEIHIGEYFISLIRRLETDVSELASSMG